MNSFIAFFSNYADVIFWLSVIIATILTIVDGLKLQQQGNISFLQFYKQSFKRSYVFIIVALLMLVL